MVSQTSSKWTPAGLAGVAKYAALIRPDGTTEYTDRELAWADLVYTVVYGTALLNPMDSAEAVEESAKQRLATFISEPRMRTLREHSSFTNHGHGDCTRPCCISIYDQLERQ